MSIFDVYANKDKNNQYKAIKRGFSWTALFFGAIWALSNKLYGFALLYVLVSIVAALGAAFLKSYAATISTALFYALPIVFGYFGNNWKRTKQIKNGYTLAKTVYASDAQGAISADPIGATYENVSSTGTEWSSDNDELIQSIIKANSHPKVAIDAIKEIYNKGVNINAKNNEGRTALGIARYYEVPTAVKAILIAAGATE